MKKIILLFIFCIPAAKAFAQKETFDIVSYALPKGWKKTITDNIISYSITNLKTKGWCQIGIVKSTISKGTIEQDFKSEWEELVVKNYKPTAAPQLNEVQETDGWKIKSGGTKFNFNNSDAIAMLTTMSGFERCVSIIATTNSQDYLKAIASFLESVSLKKPAGLQQTTSVQTELPPVKATGGFTFTTTTFDDGWTSNAKEDWVEVTKGNIKVLIHYPNKNADAYNSVLMDGLKNAWNILVAPKYSSATNMEFKSSGSWESIEFAEVDVIEKTTGKTVHVVLFKKNFSGGGGKFIEFITPDKKTFEQEFGTYENASANYGTGTGFDKMINMVNYNKFAVAASDLNGKWTSNFTGMTQYVNAYTGASAGANTHASNENFEFGAGQTYKWDLGVASGFIGNIKFQSAKSTGRFSIVNNWQVKFSDIEGKPRTYNVQFVCIKGARVLWIGETGFGKKE
ncbi:MAG: hypothetical protein JWR72_109 [Flavisolibacter sp.]|nr:hypothetical protein [Flavisolibacter sp.]